MDLDNIDDISLITHVINLMDAHGHMEAHSTEARVYYRAADALRLAGSVLLLAQRIHRADENDTLANEVLARAVSEVSR